MYAKLFSSVLDSSLMDEDITTRLTFLLMLAAADRDGRVNFSDQALARRLNLPIEDLQRALDKLTRPDPNSRTRDHEGRRVIRDESGSGYILPNYGKFRDTKNGEDQRAMWREKKRAQRSTQTECPQLSPNVLDIQGQSKSVPGILGQSPMSNHTDTDTEADTEKSPVSHPVPKTLPLFPQEKPLSPSQKRRLEAEKTASIPIPPPLNSPAFQAVWKEWNAHRADLAASDKKKPWTPRAASHTLQLCLDAGESASISAIKRAIASGWQGLHFDKPSPFATPQPKPPGSYPAIR